jgi:hypothetical protein
MNPQDQAILALLHDVPVVEAHRRFSLFDELVTALELARSMIRTTYSDDPVENSRIGYVYNKSPSIKLIDALLVKAKGKP